MPAERRPGWRPGLLLALASTLAGCGGAPSATKHGVVLIVVDTLRADAIIDPRGVYATPGIDALGADGIRFTRAFSHAPMTLPSHTALFSSRPPFETGVLNNWQPVREDLPLLAEWLKRFGYQTRAVIGLGTLSPQPGSGGLDRGFDDFDVDFWNMAPASDVLDRARASLAQIDPKRPFFFFAHFSDPHAPYNAHGAVRHEAELVLDGQVLDTLVTSELDLHLREVELEAGKHVFEVRSGDDFRIRAFQVLDGNRKLDLTWTEGGLRQQTGHAGLEVQIDEPGTYGVRTWVNDAINRRDSRKRYVKEVEYVDEHVGRLVDELKRLGLYDDALVIFTSDHGEALGERQLVGHVQNVFDELVHVPLVVKPPAGHAETGRLAAAGGSLVALSDLVPTILDLVGLPDLPGQRGVSLLDDRPHLVISETHKPEAEHDFIALRGERYKMILDVEAGTFTMFDLVEDPGEEHDVFARRRGERESWVEQLETIGRVVKEGGMLGAEQDPEVLERLKALGYF